MAKVKSFVDELIEVNKRIPRRLLRNTDGSIQTSDGQIISPSFIHIGIITVFPISPSHTHPFFFQLGRKEYRGGRGVSRDEANLALGRDFTTVAEDYDISAMLRAAEIDSNGINGYFLGANNIDRNPTRVEIPVAYFHIPEEVHKSLAINPKEKPFKDLISKIRQQYPR